MRTLRADRRRRFTLRNTSRTGWRQVARSRRSEKSTPACHRDRCVRGELRRGDVVPSSPDGRRTPLGRAARSTSAARASLASSVKQCSAGERCFFATRRWGLAAPVRADVPVRPHARRVLHESAAGAATATRLRARATAPCAGCRRIRRRGIPRAAPNLRARSGACGTARSRRRCRGRPRAGCATG